MSTIAYRDGVMASDSGAWIDDIAITSVRKIGRAQDGTLFGVCGNGPECQAFLQWVRSGGIGMGYPVPIPVDNNRSSFCILRVRRDGLICLITARGVEEFPHLKYLAVGAGSSVAMGALWYGASARDAIAAAIEHASNTRGPVDFLTHEEASS